MADLENFEKLVSSLTLDERQSLLEKLKGQSTISDEPLYFPDFGATVSRSVDEEYVKLPWFLRFWYALLGFFKSRVPVEIYMDKQVSTLGKKVDDKSPGVFDSERGLLLYGFYIRLLKLKEASRYFYSALDTSVNRDRSAFFAFLASLEMPEVHKFLHDETNPAAIHKKNPGVSAADLRQIALGVVDTAFGMITDKHRADMYYNVRSLFCLKQLSSFLFDRVIMAFSARSQENSVTCSAMAVRELLVTLNDYLFSLKTVPPMTLFESLFVFVMQDRAGQAGFNLNQEISTHLAKTENAINVIRDFNKHIPLTWIIRCSARDMTISPREVSGGEDWLMIFRDYWKKRVEALCTEFLDRQRQGEMIGASRQFLNGKNPKTLENVQSESNPEGMPVNAAFTLSFLLSFYSEIFIREMNSVLRPLLNDGEYQRKEHAVEFAVSYNELLNLEKQIKKFDMDISPEEDYGRRYAQARQDMSSISTKRRKIQLILDEVSEEADAIITQTVQASRSIMNILIAMPKQQAGTGTSGKKAADSSIDEIISRFHKFLNLIDDIATMKY